MHCLMSFYFCLLILLITCSKTTAEAIDMFDIKKDIRGFNKTCSQDECDNESSASDTLSSRSCHCSIQCVQLGTCCPGSYYADIPQRKLQPTCRSVYNGGTYYMVDDCPSGSAWRNLCKEEWNRDNDIQKLVPVTSMSTSITYKNYFCFRCYETHDDYLYWIVKIESSSDQKENFDDEAKQLDKHISIIYHRDIDTWMRKYNGDGGYVPVKVSIITPSEIEKLTHICIPDIISDCSGEWSDDEVRIKCHSYMSIKQVVRNSVQFLYRNIHCALCNFESLNDANCRPIVVRLIPTTRVFSLSNLIDVNPDGGETVGKIQKCSDGQTWDPFSRKCRIVTCLLPGFKLKNNECVEE